MLNDQIKIAVLKRYQLQLSDYLPNFKIGSYIIDLYHKSSPGFDIRLEVAEDWMFTNKIGYHLVYNHLNKTNEFQSIEFFDTFVISKKIYFMIYKRIYDHLKGSKC